MTMLQQVYFLVPFGGIVQLYQENPLIVIGIVMVDLLKLSWIEQSKQTFFVQATYNTEWNCDLLCLGISAISNNDVEIMKNSAICLDSSCTKCVIFFCTSVLISSINYSILQYICIVNVGHGLCHRHAVLNFLPSRKLGFFFPLYRGQFPDNLKSNIVTRNA